MVENLLAIVASNRGYTFDGDFERLWKVLKMLESARFIKEFLKKLHWKTPKSSLWNESDIKVKPKYWAKRLKSCSGPLKEHLG